MTLAATLATAPLAAHHFGTVSLTAIPANLLALPAIAPAMWLGMLAGALGQIPGAPVEPLTALGGLCAAFIGWVASAFGARVRAARGRRAGVWRDRARDRCARRRAPRLHRARGAARACGARRRPPRPRRGWRSRSPRPRRLAGDPRLAGRTADPEAAHPRAPDPDPGRRPGRRDPARAPARPPVLVDAGPPDGGVADRLRELGIDRLGASRSPTTSSTTRAASRRSSARSTSRRLVQPAAGARRCRSGRVPGDHAASPPATVRVGRAAPRRPLAAAAELAAAPIPNASSAGPHARLGRFDALLAGDAEAELAPIDPGPVELLKVAHHGSADAGLAALLGSCLARARGRSRSEQTTRTGIRPPRRSRPWPRTGSLSAHGRGRRGRDRGPRGRLDRGVGCRDDRPAQPAAAQPHSAAHRMAAGARIRQGERGCVAGALIGLVLAFGAAVMIVVAIDIGDTATCEDFPRRSPRSGPSTDDECFDGSSERRRRSASASAWAGGHLRRRSPALGACVAFTGQARPLLCGSPEAAVVLGVLTFLDRQRSTLAPGELAPAYLLAGDDRPSSTRRWPRCAPGPSARAGRVRSSRSAPTARPTRTALIAAIPAMSLTATRRYLLADGVERWRAAQAKPVIAALASLPPDLTVVLVAREAPPKVKAPKGLVEAVEAAGRRGPALRRAARARPAARLVAEAERRGFELDAGRGAAPGRAPRRVDDCGCRPSSTGWLSGRARAGA